MSWLEGFTKWTKGPEGPADYRGKQDGSTAAPRANPVETGAGYAIVRVSLTKGGIEQTIELTLPFETAAQETLELWREEKPVLTDFYLAKNDAALAKRLERPALIRRA